MSRIAMLAAVILPCLGMVASAQDFPDRPVTIVVGFSPGGGMDTIARTVGEELATVLGQEVVVENRPGAGGTIAAADAANANPDGYTLYLSETSALLGPVIYPDAGYDPIESFTPVAHLTSAPLALVANPEVPATNMEEFIELVSASPGEYFYATSGVATVQHLAGEMLADEANLELEPVPFQGGSPSVTAVVSGEVPFAIVSLNAAVSQAEGGNLTILGVTSAERVDDFPDLPAISETVEGFSATPSQFLMAPAGTPEDVLATLTEAVGEAMQDEELLEALNGLGFVPDYMPGPELAEELPETTQRWTEVAQNADLQ